MSVVTKKGDDGFTDSPNYENNNRVRKDDAGIECIGELDELDAFLALAVIVLRAGGTIRFADIIEKAREILFSSVMPDVMNITATSCSPAPPRVPARTLTLNVEWLEEEITALEKKYTFRGFVRNWKKPSAAILNIARTICRRCERRMVSAAANHAGNNTARAEAFQWINRLSDLLFVLAVSEEQSG